MNAFPWENAMKFGLGILRLSPAQFWGMTPRELSAAYEANAQLFETNAPMANADLASLMEKFPDTERKKND